MSARAALTRLIPLAMSDTGQARRVADFLMAWWNRPDLGHFQIADMFGLHVAIANDITTIIGFLGQNDRGAVYIEALVSPRGCRTSSRCGASRPRRERPDCPHVSGKSVDIPTAPKRRTSERRSRTLLGRGAEEDERVRSDKGFEQTISGDFP